MFSRFHIHSLIQNYQTLFYPKSQFTQLLRLKPFNGYVLVPQTLFYFNIFKGLAKNLHILACGRRSHIEYYEFRATTKTIIKSHHYQLSTFEERLLMQSFREKHLPVEIYNMKMEHHRLLWQ